MKIVWTGISILGLMIISGASYAPTQPLPEPGVLGLAGIGAAVAIAATWLKKRK